MKIATNNYGLRLESDKQKTRQAALQKARKALAETTSADEESFKPYISMYSLSLTLLQLVELYDSQPGKEKRMKLLDDLAKEFNQFTSFGSSERRIRRDSRT